MEDSKQQFTSLESQLEFLSKNLEEELDSYRNLYVLEPKMIQRKENSIFR